MASDSEILLTQQQHSDLSCIAQSRSLPAGYVFRAKLILMLADGASFHAMSASSRPRRPPSFAGSSASGNADSKDWTPFIPAKSPAC